MFRALGGGEIDFRGRKWSFFGCLVEGMGVRRKNPAAASKVIASERAPVGARNIAAGGNGGHFPKRSANAQHVRSPGLNNQMRAVKTHILGVLCKHYFAAELEADADGARSQRREITVPLIEPERS